MAEKAGVHVSTASRALNPETRSVVSEHTVRRVVEAADALGYRPHPLARGLRTNRTLTVGMVIPDFTNPLFPLIFIGAEQAMAARGYSVLAGNTDNDFEHTERVVESLVARRVDGLILATATREDPITDGLIGRGVPTVLVNRTVDDPSVPSIVGDDRAGIGLAMEHLAKLGHRRVAHVAGPQSTSTGLARRAAYEHWLDALGLEADGDLVGEAEWFQVDPGYEVCRDLLADDGSFTAVVAANDLLALGCYRALAERGLRIPDDVAVVGYNDMAFIDLVDPPLTSVRVPYYEMGIEAANALLRLLEADEKPARDRPVPPTLMAPTLTVRGSTGPAAG